MEKTEEGMVASPWPSPAKLEREQHTAPEEQTFFLEYIEADEVRFLVEVLALKNK
jgi:hypothetical protein